MIHNVRLYFILAETARKNNYRKLLYNDMYTIVVLKIKKQNFAMLLSENQGI